MSTKKIQARLNRLEASTRASQAIKEQKKLPFEFPIDPEVVQAIQAEKSLLQSLKDRKWSGEEPPEMKQAHARLTALASSINCPPSYGFKEYCADDERLKTLWPLDAIPTEREKAQVEARMEAYNQTPEGRARLRLDYLQAGPGFYTAAAFEEMERLIDLYPEPWHGTSCTAAWNRALRERGTAKDRKARFEKYQYLLRKREETRKSEAGRKKGPD